MNKGTWFHAVGGPRDGLQKYSALTFLIVFKRWNAPFFPRKPGVSPEDRFNNARSEES